MLLTEKVFIFSWQIAEVKVSAINKFLTWFAYNLKKPIKNEKIRKQWYDIISFYVLYNKFWSFFYFMAVKGNKTICFKFLIKNVKKNVTQFVFNHWIGLKEFVYIFDFLKKFGFKWNLFNSEFIFSLVT